MKKKKVIFVCWGNIHRSPLAEEFLKYEISTRNLSDKINVRSYGLQGYKNNPRSQFKNFTLYPQYETSRKFLTKKGVDFSKRSSRPINKSAVDTSDLIIAMDEKVLVDKQYGLKANFPSAKYKTILFSEISGGNKVEDPYLSTNYDTFIETANIIETGIKNGFNKILSIIGLKYPSLGV